MGHDLSPEPDLGAAKPVDNLVSSYGWSCHSRHVPDRGQANASMSVARPSGYGSVSGRIICPVLQLSKSIPDTTGTNKRRIPMASAKSVDVTVWYDYT